MLVVAVLASVCSALANELPACDVGAYTQAGWVCGLRRWAEDGHTYASFRGVPFAKQPIGKLRFKELEQPDPWDGYYDARVEGPACLQRDRLYRNMTQFQGMSEACIHANIHVPYEALPTGNGQQTGEIEDKEDKCVEAKKALPILVFIHGGAFAYGSGDTDVHGPEYLVTRGIIVMTFNYRLNVFGFLGLNTTTVPGNMGLRDMVTFLRWVQNNARAFGGDPDNVTIGGQSAGAVSAHLLTLSKATKGLFQRAILMSGVATAHFYSPTPAFAQFISNLYLNLLGIDTITEHDEVYQCLMKMPAERLTEANSELLDIFGLTTFMPVIESPMPGVTTILDDYPEVLIAQGRGKDIPLIIGYTNGECEPFRRILLELDIVRRIQENPNLMVTPKVLYAYPENYTKELIMKFNEQYFNGNMTLNNYIRLCSDSYFEYPALDVAGKRAMSGGAPVYLYDYEYESENNLVQEAFGVTYEKAGHIEDLTYIFRINSMLGSHASFPPKTRDDCMKYWMTSHFVNFMTKGVPDYEPHNPPYWPPVDANGIKYQVIEKPGVYQMRGLSTRQRDMIKFFNSVGTASGAYEEGEWRCRG